MAQMSRTGMRGIICAVSCREEAVLSSSSVQVYFSVHGMRCPGLKWRMSGASFAMFTPSQGLQLADGGCHPCVSRNQLELSLRRRPTGEWENSVDPWQRRRNRACHGADGQGCISPTFQRIRLVLTQVVLVPGVWDPSHLNMQLTGASRLVQVHRR